MDKNLSISEQYELHDGYSNLDLEDEHEEDFILNCS